MTILSESDESFQAYFDQVYQGMPALKSPSPEETRQAREVGICSTYGELLYYSVQKIADRMQLTADDVFCDLGSGMGKCALQIFMQTAVKRVIGIESHAILSEKAASSCQEIRTAFPFFWEEGREIAFVKDNFLNCDWGSPTALYTCSTCFDTALLNAIGDKINQTPSIRQVMSLRPLPSLTRLKCVNIFRVECSWDSALCYHYAK